MKTAKGSQQRGFTAVEIVIVVLVIAVLAAISIPLVSHWLMQYRLGIAGRQVADTLQMAKMQAVARTQRRELLFDLKGNRLGIEGRELVPLPTGVSFSLGSARIPPDPSVPIDQPVTFPPLGDNVNLRAATFTGRGLPDGAPGETYAVYLSNASGTSVVTMTSAGNIRVQRWDGSTWH